MSTLQCVNKAFSKAAFGVYSIFSGLLTCCYPVFSQGFNIDYSPWEPFAASLAQCSMGKFVLPDPTKIIYLTHRLQQVATGGPNVQNTIIRELNQATVTYEIYGWDNNNQCVVSITQHRFEANAPPTSAPYGMECNFSKADLQTLAQSAQKISKGNLPTYWVDPDTTVRGKACRSKVIEVPSVLPSPQRDTQLY